jgi:predicted nuclease of predicted toxin-antitoxin system
VKILFDANTPAPLAQFLRGHEVVQAEDLGWHALENGKLLSAAEQARFEVLVTCDQNIRHQQNFTLQQLRAKRAAAAVFLVFMLWPRRPLR